MLHQMGRAGGTVPRMALPARASRRARVGRQRGERCRRGGDGRPIDPRSHSDRGAARDPAQHQRRRIFRLVGAAGRLDAEGYGARARNDEAAPLSPAGRRGLSRSRADRHGDHQSRLCARPRARPEPGRVPPEARFRRLHAGLERAVARGKDPDEWRITSSTSFPIASAISTTNRGESDVSIIGYCFGGVLSALYASIFPDGPL